MSRRFLRYVFVGALNTAFGYGCYAVLLYAGLTYPMALLVATLAGVIFNFLMTGRVVFGNSDNRLILRFLAVYTLVYSIHLAALRVLITSVGLNAYLANALCVLPIAVLSYKLLRQFVFRTA